MLPPERVRRAASSQMINPRGPEFAELLCDCTAGLRTWLETDNNILFMPASGTGALEATVANLRSPGESALFCTMGWFGELWARIATAFGVDAVRLESAWGAAIDPAALADTLERRPGLRTVFITHNETSTGVRNDLLELAAIVKALAAEDAIRAGALRDLLGVEGQGRDDAIASRDLVASRDRLERAGVPTLRCGAVARVSDLYWYGDAWGYPVRVRHRRVAGWPIADELRAESDVRAFTRGGLSPKLETVPSLVAEPGVHADCPRVAASRRQDGSSCIPSGCPGLAVAVAEAAALRQAASTGSGWRVELAAAPAEGWCVETIAPGARFAVAALIDSLGTGRFLAGSALFFTRELRLSPGQVGLGLTLAGMIGFATTVPWGRAADRWGARRILVLLLSVRAVAFGLYVFADSLAAFLAITALLGLVEKASSPVHQVLIGEAVGAERRQRALALTRSTRNVGFALGALAAAAAVSTGSRVGYDSIVLLNAVSFVIAAGLMATLPAAGRARSKPDVVVVPRRLVRDRRYAALTAINGVLTLHMPLLSMAAPLLLTAVVFALGSWGSRRPCALAAASRNGALFAVLLAFDARPGPPRRTLI